MAKGCAFCTELTNLAEKLGDKYLDDTYYNVAVEALFDRADRASRAHRLYGRRKGHQ